MARGSLNFAAPEPERGQPMGLGLFTSVSVGFGLLAGLVSLLIAGRI